MVSVAVTGAAVKVRDTVDNEGVGSLFHLGAQLVQLCGDRFQAVALLQAQAGGVHNVGGLPCPQGCPHR